MIVTRVIGCLTMVIYRNHGFFFIVFTLKSDDCFVFSELCRECILEEMSPAD